MDFEQVEHDLYGLPAAGFTAERDARAKAAKADGDKELAARIKALKRPTASAVAVNQLVRTHPGDVAPLLELGAELRAATAARQGAELRTLSGRQQTLLRDLGRQAARLAADAGQPLTAATARAVDDTLRAAVADPALGEQLRRGCLADAFGPVDVFGGFGAVGFEPREPREPPTAPVVDLRARQLAKATAAAEAAADRLATAASALTTATNAHDAAAAHEAELRTQLTEATKRRESLQEKRIKAERAVELASAAATETAETLAALRQQS